MNRTIMKPALLAFGVALAACDAQVDGRYEGEPLATLRGDITTSALGAPQGAEGARLAIVWTPQTGKAANGEDIMQAQGTEVTVAGSFPASFELVILEPPPDAALFDTTIGGEATKYAQGVFLVLAPEAPIDAAMPWQDLWGHVRGAEPKHNIVYVSEDVPADPHYGGVALRRGYHLFYGVNNLAPGDSHVPTEEEIARCYENHLTSYGVIVPDMTRYCDRDYGGWAVAGEGLDTKLSVRMAAPPGEHPYIPYLPLVW
jgi:hypothetical protein